MARQKQLLVGTGKGLILYEKKGGKWTYQGDRFLGLPVSSMYVNEWTGDWWIGLAHKHWGQKLHRSTDQGHSWQEVPAPRYPCGFGGFAWQSCYFALYMVHFQGEEQTKKITYLSGLNPEVFFIARKMANPFNW